MENLETALEPEGTRTKLKRELRAEAMTRLEEAARTEADFENVEIGRASCRERV